ncbi:ATP-binding cassette domain-containing protein [Actinomycetaceae bacterium TAE3-ERU4]|nr:ATP-binding cassette domain-containing protein [Actinomycetaceae bacterium TAE3-ERU4]
MLEISHLNKQYGDLTAVKDLNFQLNNGEIVGFVGSNGAGKSTTMRITMGVLNPTSGEVKWEGSPITKEDRRTFGYMPEERGLYPKMTVEDQLVYFARLHGLDKASATSAMEKWTEKLGISERRKDNLQKLSLGNQQRVQLASALVFDPALLILDEPFSGLDPVAVEVMSNVLKEQSQKGVATLFSSHQLDLVERLCDRVIIIQEGKLIADDSVKNIKRQGTKEWELSTSSPGNPLPELAGRINGRTEEKEGITTLIWDGSDRQEILRALTEDDIAIERFSPRVPSLTELFRDVVATPTVEGQSA